MPTRTLLVALSLSLLATLAPPASAADSAPSAPDPCPGRAGFQAYEGSCLPDRLVAYLKCIEKTGGNRLKVTRDESSKNASDLTVGVEGEGKGLVIKGAGKVNVGRKKVDEAIKKVDEVYGDRSAECLLAAGLTVPAATRRPGPAPAAKTATTPAISAAAGKSGGDASGVRQELNTGAVSASEGGTVKGATVSGATGKNVDQKVKVSGSVNATKGGTVELGTVKQ